MSAELREAYQRWRLNEREAGDTDLVLNAVGRLLDPIPDTLNFDYNGFSITGVKLTPAERRAVEMYQRWLIGGDE